MRWRCLRQRLRNGMVAAAAATLVAACSGTATKDPTLYTRLGGEAGIAGIVEELVVNIAADERIRHHFAQLHIAGFRGRLETHFCEIADGPCDFDGRTMRESHRLLGISEGDFNALVEDLIDAMQTRGIAYGTQNEFLARLAPMRPDIVVEVPPAGRGADP